MGWCAFEFCRIWLRYGSTSYTAFESKPRELVTGTTCSKQLGIDSFFEIMADPFEVRMRFTSQLQNLNASIMSSQKAAHYALKCKDMDEDLHSCILEQLERVSAQSSPFRWSTVLMIDILIRTP